MLCCVGKAHAESGPCVSHCLCLASGILLAGCLPTHTVLASYFSWAVPSLLCLLLSCSSTTQPWILTSLTMLLRSATTCPRSASMPLPWPSNPSLGHGGGTAGTWLTLLQKPCRGSSSSSSSSSTSMLPILGSVHGSSAAPQRAGRAPCSPRPT